MNEVQISSLKNILKKYRVKTASNVVTSNMDLNYEKFLEASEVIYVVDRIQSCYTNEKDIARLMDVKKEWISIIIEKGWCSPLIPFIDQYGASLTKRAIIYLIENNLWDSYDGKTALRNKQPDHYKGLLAIHEAAIYLQSEAPEEEPSEQEQSTVTEDMEGEKPQNIEFVDSKDEKSEAEIAFDASINIKNVLSSCLNDFDVLGHYIMVHCNASEAEKEIASLKEVIKSIDKKRSELSHTNECQLRLLMKKDKELKEMQELVSVRNDEIGKVSKELSDVKDELSSLKIQSLNTTQDYANLKDKYDELEVAYKKMKDASQLPVKRVIPLSKFKELPLVGDKILVGVIPFLEKYNVIFDYNK